MTEVETTLTTSLNDMGTLINPDLAKNINARWADIEGRAKDTVSKAIELGGELTTARNQVGYGFQKWVAHNLEMSPQHAYRLMKMWENRDHLSDCSSVTQALKVISGNKGEEWVAAGYADGEMPLSEAEDAPEHIEILSLEIHPMFMLDPVNRRKWQDIQGATVYRTIINGKPLRVAGTVELLSLGNQQGITRLPHGVLSLDQGNQQRREGQRNEDAWAARKFADKAMSKLSPDPKERELQLVQFLEHGLPKVQREWVEQRLGVDLDTPGNKAVDAIWALLLLRSEEDLWSGFKKLSGLDPKEFMQTSRETHRLKRLKISE